MYHLWHKTWHIYKALEDPTKWNDFRHEVRDTLLVDGNFL
jgi:hypothetical protein